MITIVLGAQFGGEGKGKITAFLAKRRHFSAVCRAGGVNCSHTVLGTKKTFRLRLVPTTCVEGTVDLIVFGAGVLLHIPTLFEEMRALSIDPARVLIDFRTGIVEDAHVKLQRADERYRNIGSTLTGTGYASAERCQRKLRLARQFPELRNLLGDVPVVLAELLHGQNDIIIEGHQAFGLSNYHGDYPFCSSRDTTAAAHLSEIGLGPNWGLEVVLVVRAFPVRNHAGCLANEMTPKEVEEVGVHEFGGGSWGIPDRHRRVGRLDMTSVRRACVINTADAIALTGADYLDPRVRDATSPGELTPPVMECIRNIEQCTEVPVRYVSTGPATSSVVELYPRILESNGGRGDLNGGSRARQWL